MEKQILEKNENMMSICHRTNDEFLKGLLFVTYYLKQNPYNDDLEDAKEYWIYTNNFIDDWKNTFPYLYETLEEKERVLKDLFFDAEQVISFYLEDTNQSTSSLSNAISELINSLSIDEIKTALLGLLEDDRSREMLSTPNSVISLSKKLLNIKKEDSVLDLCSGKGSFLRSIEETKDITGIEINNDILKESYLLCLLNNKMPVFNHQDAMTYSGKKFNKIFCEYPWGYIYNRPIQSLACDKWEPLPIKDIKRSSTSWLFVSKVLSILKKDGIAVVHCNDGALFSTYESDVRKMAISKGLIKGVISLPQKLHSATNVGSSLLILSYNNTSIRFVDASSFGEINPITRCVELNYSDINNIMCMFLSDEKTDQSITVSNNEIEESYLNVNRYLRPATAPIIIKDGVKFESVVNDIIKSTVSNSAFLTKDPSTGIKVLSSSDIKDGAVDISKLNYLSENGKALLPRNWEKGILANGDVVMTNKSTTIKSAVVDISNETILLFGSLYGIRLKTEKMIPTYLCSFINSNAGQLLLKTIQTGTTIMMITVSNLRNITIPCPSLSDQGRLCEQVSIILDMIKDSKERIVKLQKNYESSFDELLTEEE